MRNRRMGKKLVSMLLLIALFIQAFSVMCFAVTDGASFIGSIFSPDKESGIKNGIGKFDSDEAIAQLKKELLSSINRDLLAKVEDYELKGDVQVIITFSDDSLISAYNSDFDSRRMSFSEYRNSAAANKLKTQLERNQDRVLGRLEESGLINSVEHNYFNIMDGAAVKTTYEKLEAISKVEGVERLIISNTYLPAVAVENPVDVYETGIFNSSDIKFTGQGTVVAVLDTGCDYTHSAFTSYEVIKPRLDRSDIEAVLTKLEAYGYDPSLKASEVYYGNLTGEKIVFGYDYADKDPDIMPFSQSHGTHVAGVIGGKDDVITGVAIDTQFAIMKVFSDYKQGAEDADILAALEDSVTLGVDAINMSLGTSCGFTREVDEQYKNDVYDRIQDAGISLIVAASNDYSSGFGGEESNTNKTDNPDSATVGSPSTYDAAMSVASINGRKEKYMLVNGDLEVFFTEAFNMKSEEYNFFEMLGITKDNPTAEFEYVTIPGVGYAINYSGLDMTGKIALVRRGDITFEEKVQFAREAGAAGIIIYNNVFGSISMTVGNDLEIPVVSIGKDEGDAMAAFPTGKITFDYSNEAGPFMSDFSSWGPAPDLSLKPEITAHGGNILSAVVGGEYDELSGTSMAAPNLCGIVVLIRQFVKEKYDLTDAEIRDRVNQLCMSTATIALDKYGNPYSPRKQGAGIADISKATETTAFLYVDDGSGKTKLELGDDPTRSGVYVMTIQLKNVSDENVKYRLGNIVMTESVSTSDPEYVAEKAYILSPSLSYSVSGGTLVDGVVSVAAGAEATVTATVTLSAEDKSYLNSTFENGMYVEGFFTFDNVEEDGVDLNAPFLAFYGDWGEAPLFDLDYYEVETEAHNDAIDDDEKIKADYYPTTPMGSYYYDYLLPLGSYVYDIDKSMYTPIPATEEHAALSYYSDAISGIYGVFAGLLRGAKEMNISIVDTSTGREVWSKTEYNCYKSHFSAAVTPYRAPFNLSMVDSESQTAFGGNNTRYEVTMTAKLDWKGEERNSSDTYTFSFYIDYEAPTVVDASFRTEYDKTREENRYYADIIVYDNHYAMSIRPILVYEYEEEGEIKKTYSPLATSPIPIYQENRGETTKVTIEITDYIDIVAESSIPQGLTVYIDDYAMNANVAYIPFDDTDSSDLEFMESELTLNIHDTLDLSTYLVYEDTTKTVNTAYLKTLTWTSSDESVVAISGGKIEALKEGTATVSVTGNSWKSEDGVQLSKSIVIKVSGTENKENPESSKLVMLEDLEFTSYETLFAFNGDIDFSLIGQTGSINYFGGNYNLTCYPSEKVKLNYNLKPWNIDESRYTLKWSSSNSKVATVDENGVVTAESEGSARISLQITIDGRTSTIAARCSFTVKSEFVIADRTLVAYKGKGGDVVIPDDEGITSIGAFAFCHYNLDNEREVEKDEDGYYDIDLKKDPLGNNTVTSVVIPDGVETISKYAFYNCKILRDVTLPESCETISEYAFAKCDVLENINLENVKIVLDYGLYQCASLTCDDISGADLSRMYAIGKYAFAETRLKEVNLTKLSRVSEGAFADCTKLTTVELGEKTRIAPKMFRNTAITNIVLYSDAISDEAFKGCKELTTVEIRNNISYLGKEAFSECTKLNEVIFDGDCEEIAEFAFNKCTSLETFKLPNCELKIGDAAFAYSGLKKLVFAEKTFITEGGISVFDSVKAMSADTAGSEYYAYNAIDGVVYSIDGTRLVLVLPGYSRTTFTVPSSVTEICDGAFASNTKIQTVTFDEGSQLNRIGIGAFANCTALRSVALPNSTVEIAPYAFIATTALKTINLENVSKVGEYAFNGSAIATVNLASDNVTIGEAAFYGCTGLNAITLGKGASIGEYAFADSSLKSVDILGSGATVGEGAFAACIYLTSFDFADLTGRLGDMAFYACTSLVSVVAPNVTELGESCFGDCYALKEFKAENLEVVGAYAFAPYSENATQGASFESFYAPKLAVIGEGAFNACVYLKSIDLSNVREMGFGAFYMCLSLESVTLTETLAELPDYAFFGCEKLSGVSLDNIVRFGMYSLYGVQLPANLVLPKAEYLAMGAFAEFFSQDFPIVNYLESVDAPELKVIEDQAFYLCQKLVTVNAPKLEEIGSGAFAFTAIAEFEITNNLKTVDLSTFEGSDKFVAFYTTVDGEKVYTYDKYENVMINEGALYTVAPVGYILTCYPTAKTDKVLTVVDGTARIDFGAALGNKYIERVIFPESLEFIGNFAFYQCENLKTVVFNSYYAPTLEGTLSGNPIEINPETVKDYPGFDKLYKYDYYFRMEDIVATPVYYSTFKDVIISTGASDLTYVIPKNSNGYDSRIYNAYFLASTTEDSGDVKGPAAISFIKAVERLPEILDRFDEALINEAINAYNALVGTSDMSYVDESYVEKFTEARMQYNVSVVENKIAHLFDMDNSKYSYDKVKDASTSYDALSAAEMALVKNASVLEEKKADLALKMGKTLDFSLSYEDYFPKDDPEPPVDNPPVGGDEDNNGWMIAIIIISSVVGVLAVAAVVFLIIRKKKSVNHVSDASADTEEDTKED